MRNKKRLLLLLIICSMSLGIFSQESKDEKVIVFSISAALDTYNARLLDEVYSVAFKKLGYGFKLVYHPPTRALLEADLGRIDGCDGRLSEEFDSIKKLYPNLVFGDESLLTINFSAFVLGDLKVDWDTLLTGDYMLTYLRGLVVIKQKLEDINDNSRILISNDADQTIKMLVTHRVKVAILSDYTGTKVANKPENKGFDIQISNHMVSKGLYTIMNKKHKDLVLPLSNEIRKMKESGEYQDIVDNL